MAGAEVAGLPTGGPAVPEQVAAYLKVTLATPEFADVEDVCLAVNAMVRTWPCSEPSSAPDTPEVDRVWKDRVTRGSLLLAARLYRRKNSPAGVEAFTEAGPVYVQRNDPDVAMLLNLGAYLLPELG